MGEALRLPLCSSLGLGAGAGAACQCGTRVGFVVVGTAAKRRPPRWRQAALSNPPPTKGVRRGNRAQTDTADLRSCIYGMCMACACAWHVHGTFDRRRRLDVLLLTVLLRGVAPRSVNKSAEGHAREEQAGTDASHHPHGALYHHGRRCRRRWRPGRARRWRQKRRRAGLWHSPRWRRRWRPPRGRRRRQVL